MHLLAVYPVMTGVFPFCIREDNEQRGLSVGMWYRTV